jgi:hypothetical protein
MGFGLRDREIISVSQADTNSIVQIDYYPMTSEYNPPSSGGTQSLVEYGITDWLSAGLRCNAFDFFLHGLRDDYWALFPSAFVTAKALDYDWYSLNIQNEFQVSPILSIPKISYPGYGLLLDYATFSNNFRLAKGKDTELFAYADLKNIVAIVNTDYQSDNFYKTYFSSWDGNNLITTEVPVGTRVYHPMDRLALALGLDFYWGKAQVNLGVNAPLIDFSLDNGFYASYLDGILSQLTMSSLELNWRWRL